MEQRAFRIYVTDALFAAVNNTARFAGGSQLQKRFADVVYADNKTKTADEPEDAESIIKGIIERAGLGVEIKDGECI